jgi:hypothetical protein
LLFAFGAGNGFSWSGGGAFDGKAGFSFEQPRPASTQAATIVRNHLMLCLHSGSAGVSR